MNKISENILNMGTWSNTRDLNSQIYTVLPGKVFEDKDLYIEGIYVQYYPFEFPKVEMKVLNTDKWTYEINSFNDVLILGNIPYFYIKLDIAFFIPRKAIWQVCVLVNDTIMNLKVGCYSRLIEERVLK